MLATRVGRDGVYIRVTYIYIRVLYRENTIQYVSSGVAADWRQTRVLPQSKQTLPRINGPNIRYFIEFAMNLI